VTVNEQVAVAPPASVARQFTVVVPIEKFEPDGGEQTILAPVQLSRTAGVTKFTVPVQEPTSFPWVILGGQTIRGAGLFAIVFALATLLARFGSGVVGLKTMAVFPTIVLLGTEQFTRAVMVINALVPGAKEANVIVLLFPLPPHTPPPVASQD
jgi:hypothetical protein